MSSQPPSQPKTYNAIWRTLRVFAVDYGAFTGALVGAAGTLAGGYFAWIGVEGQIREQHQANIVAQRSQYIDEEEKLQKRLAAMNIVRTRMNMLAMDLYIAEKEVNADVNLRYIAIFKRAEQKAKDGGRDLLDFTPNDAARVENLAPDLSWDIQTTLFLLRNLTSKSEKNEDLAADVFLKTEYEKIQNLRTRFEVETSNIRRRLELINQRKQELEFRLGALNR